MSHEHAHFRLRLSPELHQLVAGEAAANGRSINAEIVARLEASGKTLRDEFAMSILCGLLANGAGPNSPWFDHPPSAAQWAYHIADAMLVERQRKAGAA